MAAARGDLWWAVGAAVAVVALAVGILWTGPSASPATDATGPTGALSEPSAASITAACTATPGTPCIQDQLETVLLARGDEVTFALLEDLARNSSAVMTMQHDIAHHLGRVSLDYYANATEALRHCPTTMASGCFHGVLERYFNDAGPPAVAADVTGLCKASDGRFRQYQCLHGLGHGLDMVAMHELPTAITWCELFTDAWSRESCGGGVFMENVQGDTTMQHDMADMPGMDPNMPMNMTWVPMKYEDPQYPCNQVSPNWGHACYWLQSSLYYKLGYTTPQAFAGCDKAPAPHDGTCYESMGRDISGATLRRGPAIVTQCQLGNATRLPRCIYGAVQEMVNNAGAPQPGFAFCPIVPTAAKRDCYLGLGGMIYSLTPSQSDRAAFCLQSEQAYIDACDDGANA